MLDFGFYNMDCMDGMSEFPDKYFDLAIVDPPYGIKRLENPNGRLKKYGDTRKANNNIPDIEYFEELERVSKNQIIWGGNYFDIKPCRCFIAWYKHQPVDNYSDCEFAWTSFDKPAKVFDYPYFGNINADDCRLHPTQKPVPLLEYLIKTYTNEGETVLDNCMGSGSTGVACVNTNRDFIGIELDEHYFQIAQERIETATRS